jgi:hypothetical protein
VPRSASCKQAKGVHPRRLVQYVGRLAAQGRLPWLPTGRSGGGPRRAYRRAQIEVIAQARGRTQRRS